MYNSLLFIGLGMTMIIVSLFSPDFGELVFSLGILGIFSGLLTAATRSTNTIPLAIADEILQAQAANLHILLNRKDIDGGAVYVPNDGETSEQPSVLLSPAEVPAESPKEHPRDVIVLQPCGSALFPGFRDTLKSKLSSDLPTLVDQLIDGLIHHLEFTERVEVETLDSTERVTLRLFDPVLGGLDHFDHPIVSFICVVLVSGLDRPVAAHQIESSGNSVILELSLL